MDREKQAERDRAMFGKVDRKYLLKLGDYVEMLNRKSKWDRRKAICDRLLGTLKDFELAERELGGQVWDDLLKAVDDTPRDVRDGMVSAIALFFEIHEARGWDFEATLRRAVEEAYLQGHTKRDMPHRDVNEVRFSVDADEPPGIGEIRERVAKKLENDEPLTHREVGVAIEQGLGESVEALQEHFEQRRIEESREEKFEERGDDRETFGESDGE